MITKEEAAVAHKTLSFNKVAKIGHFSMLFVLEQIDFSQNIHINTLVYQGDKFIPFGVRQAASVRVDELQRYIRTWLVINEEKYQITLHSTEKFTSDIEKFREILSEFEDVAVKWKEILEERDREDLVHIPAQSK